MMIKEFLKATSNLRRSTCRSYKATAKGRTDDRSSSIARSWYGLVAKAVVAPRPEPWRSRLSRGEAIPVVVAIAYYAPGPVPEQESTAKADSDSEQSTAQSAVRTACSPRVRFRKFSFCCSASRDNFLYHSQFSMAETATYERCTNLFCLTLF